MLRVPYDQLTLAEVIAKEDAGTWDVFHYMNCHKIEQLKDKVEVFKEWFSAGKEVYVNGSASGRVVLKYHPALIKLLKKGFIVRERRHQVHYGKRSKTADTVLVLNKNLK